MTKILSISLSFLILFQSFGLDINDIAQIDEFIEHAQFHNEEYGDTIFVFISKHYGELKAEHSKEHQEEKEDHEKLPFQHHSNISTLTAFVLNSIKEETQTISFLKFKKHNYHYQTPSSSFHKEGLFQPPRQS